MDLVNLYCLPMTTYFWVSAPNTSFRTADQIVQGNSIYYQHVGAVFLCLKRTPQAFGKRQDI